MFSLDRRMLPLKAHYFLYFAGTAPIMAYMSVYARQLGFSAVQVGWMYTILQLSSLFVKPLFGLIGDKFRCRKALILIWIALTAIAYSGIYFIEPIAPRLAFSWPCEGATNGDRLHFCPDVEPPNAGCLLQQVLGQRFGDGQRMECELECDRHSSTLTLDLTTIDQVGDCLHFHLLPVPTNSSAIAPCSTSPRRCWGTCSNPNIARLLATNSLDSDATADSSIPAQLILFVACMLLGWCGWATLESLNSAVCFALLGAGGAHRFGWQRLWGSVGWGITSVAGGFLIDAMSAGRVMADYRGLFYLMLALMVADLVVATRIESVQYRRPQAMLAQLGGLFRSGRNCVFFVWCVVVGLQTAVIWNFLFWYLEEMAEAGGSEAAQCDASGGGLKSLLGLVVAVQTFGGEIPWLFASGWLLRRIGREAAMSAVLGAFGVRFLAYSWLWQPWWVLPVELLHGVTFGVFFAAMSEYASEMAPLQAQATMQGMAGAVFEGLGVSVGNVLAGYMMREMGGPGMFRVYGYGSLVVCGVHVGAQLVLAQVEPRRRVAEGEAGAGGERIAVEGGQKPVNSGLHKMVVF